MSFGTDQLKKPTPTNVVLIVRIYTAIACAIIAWIPTVAFISHSAQDVIIPIIGLTVTLSNIVLPFFGVSTNQTTVPISEVAVMEEPKK